MYIQSWRHSYWLSISQILFRIVHTELESNSFNNLEKYFTFSWKPFFIILSRTYSFKQIWIFYMKNKKNCVKWYWVSVHETLASRAIRLSNSEWTISNMIYAWSESNADLNGLILIIKTGYVSRYGFVNIPVNRVY